MTYCDKCLTQVETIIEHRDHALFGGSTVTFCKVCGEGLRGVFDHPLYDDKGEIFMTGWSATIDIPASQPQKRKRKTMRQMLQSWKERA